MSDAKLTNMEERVIRAAETALEVKGYASPIELLKNMGLLPAAHVRYWERGVHDSLEKWIQGSDKKKALTFRLFTKWAEDRNLTPVKAVLRTSGRDQSHELQVMKKNDPEMEKFFRTYYAPSDITPKKLEALKKKLNKPPDLVVFMTVADDAVCAECGDEIERGDFIFREKDNSICLRCADLDYLEFLPSGDAAMSRRSKKYASLSALVLQFNRRAKRYERRGILVPAKAIEQAEKECLSDADQRTARRKRDEKQRVLQDEQLVESMTQQICEQFPKCPAEEAREIARHTAQRGSGRVGRSAAGRKLNAEAIRLAVIAHIRHAHTRYDELLMTGHNRANARQIIASDIDDTLTAWQN